MQLKATLVLLLIAALVIVDVDAWRRRRRRRRGGFFRRVGRFARRAYRIYRGARRIYRRYPIVRRVVRMGFRYIKRRWYDLKQLRMEDEDAYEELLANLEHDVVENFGEDIAGDVTEALDALTELNEDEMNEAEQNMQDDDDSNPEYDAIETMIRKQLDAIN